MNIDEIIKENIQNYMTKQFYMEGKDRDYYFGKSELNENLTVFYNNIGSEKANQCLEETLRDSIKQVSNADREGLRFRKCRVYSLNSSALMIPVYCFEFDWWNDRAKYDELIEYKINCMPVGVLEEAIKNNPKRWAHYKLLHG